MLDPKIEHVLADAAQQVRGLFDTRLVTVALYGSAVGPDFVPGVSDLNLVLVLDALTFADLQALRPFAARWRKQRIATPLILDRTFLHAARDVFPMELEDIKDHHRVLFGEDVFAALPVRRDNLRYQCEHEVRGKLLRLQGLYVELSGNRQSLQALMLDSLKTFLIVMRNINRISGVHEPGPYASVLQAFSRYFHSEFPVMTRLLRLKLGREQWRDDADDVFGAYLAEVQRLVQLIDQLPADDGPTDAGV